VKYPGLISFAALGDTMDAEATLRQVALKVDQVSDYDKKANLIAASAILAGLRLEDEVIYRVLRRDIMQESTVYRSIKREAEEARDRVIALNLLRQGVSVELVALCTELSIEEVQQLQSQINQSSPS
jgi:predicted transposase YdaD